MLGQAGRLALQVLSVVILARLLSPTDYGLMALALTVVALGEVFRDFGLSTAAIQAPHITRAQQSNLLWINVGLGATLALIIVASAPLLHHLERYSPVVGLLQVLSVTFIINGVLAQYRADLSRRLRFGALAVSDVVGAAVGVASAIAAALAGAGVWALAVQQLAGVITTAALAILFAGWLPRWPDRSADVRPMVRFGVGMVGTQLLGYGNNYVDTYTVALRFGPVPLGLYDRAFQLLMQPLNQFLNPTTSVAVPLLSRLTPGGEEANRLLLRGQAALGYTLMAVAAFAAGAAPAIIALALGPRWSEAAPLFAVLACAGAVQALGYVSYWAFIARGLTTHLFRYSLFSIVVRVVCVVVGSFGGLIGVAIGFAVAPLIQLPLGIWVLSRHTPYPARALLVGAGRALTAAAVAAITTGAVQHATAAFSPVVQLVACGAAAVSAYGVVALVIPSVRRDLRGVAAFARRVLTRDRVHVA